MLVLFESLAVFFKHWMIKIARSPAHERRRSLAGLDSGSMSGTRRDRQKRIARGREPQGCPSKAGAACQIEFSGGTGGRKKSSFRMPRWTGAGQRASTARVQYAYIEEQKTGHTILSHPKSPIA